MADDWNQRAQRFYRKLLSAPSPAELQRLRATPRPWNPGSVIVLGAREFIRLFDEKWVYTKSAALTYAFILSLVPLLAIVFTFFNAFNGLSSFVQGTLRPFIMKYFSDALGEQLGGYLQDFADNFRTGILGPVSAVVFLLTVVGLISTVDIFLNDIAETKLKSYVRRLVNYWVLLTLTPLVVLLSSAKSGQLLMLFQQTSQWVIGSPLLVGLARYAVGFFTQVCGLAVLYYVLINRKLRWRSIFFGAVSASLLLEVLQILNVFYVASYFSNATTMQLIGAVPALAVVFFFWLRLVFLIVLIGAVFVQVAERFRGPETDASDGPRTAASALVDLSRTLGAVGASFRKHPEGITIGSIAARTQTARKRVRKHCRWLERHGLVQPLLLHGRTRYLPTHRATRYLRHPERFAKEVLLALPVLPEPEPLAGENPAQSSTEESTRTGEAAPGTEAFARAVELALRGKGR